MKKSLLLLVAASSILAGSASAQNLLVNGDFEAGTIAPWVGGTIVANGTNGSAANTIGTLLQNVPTIVGKQYLVSADVLVNSTIGTIAALTATPFVGPPPDGTRAITGTSPIPTFARASLFFTASTSTTTISFSITPFPGFLGSLTVDNASMVEAEPSKLVGTYSGNNLVTLQLTTLDLANKASRKVTAKITAENQIYILDGVQAIFTGIILNDGAFELTTGFGTPQGAGTATIKGKRIELEFTAATLISIDSKGLPVANTVSNKIVLTKK